MVIKLGVNIDHIATLREVRKTFYPDPVLGALICEKAGADSIVCHLREDRRHIQEKDIFLLKEVINLPLNLEMSIAKEIVNFAKKIKPMKATLVPERRQELTTEGGLNLNKEYKKIEKVIRSLQKEKIKVSLFLDPDKKVISLAKNLGVEEIEINTGKYSEAKNEKQQDKEWEKIREISLFAKERGFRVAAGHGLNYENVKRISQIQEIEELNIGHSIISYALYTGLYNAVKEMIRLIKR